MVKLFSINFNKTKPYFFDFHTAQPPPVPGIITPKANLHHCRSAIASSSNFFISSWVPTHRTIVGSTVIIPSFIIGLITLTTFSILCPLSTTSTIMGRSVESLITSLE
ncbi:107aa long hypothetical protein [Pyrococcus horikoshii OT3]|uniref:Uncharacterized protein n=1 Tax=Pyrococcus horikoshii (strain ATCC 700860 / DSM 12428 / JCM 9974 / NBRC 100139 / OT-3) TaxID=70601 RepID=O59173_PYRHO|nr:107aa long hypothetical protein [Pyrococcus horikoshii OT3]